MNRFKTLIAPKLPLYLSILMLLGLILSRALLSITMVLWVIVILITFDKQKFKKYQPLLIWSLMPVILFLFGWYQHIAAKETYDYLLTLIMFPVAAFGSITLDAIKGKEKKVWVISAIGSLVYPVSVYAMRFAEMNILYGQGQSLPTLMEGDHVRYGIFLNATLLMTMIIKDLKPKIRLLLILIIVTAIIVMSVRTAWIGLIIIGLGLLVFQKQFVTFNRWLLLLLIPFFAFAWFLIPAVSQKIKYTIYDFQMYSRASYNPDFSDGARRTVNYVAWTAIKEDSANVGWAAVPSTLKNSFTKIYPGQHLTYGFPFNQWLYWWLGSGLVGMMLFTVWLLYPVYHGLRYKNYFLVIWTAVIAVSCLVESTLNLQFGVFLHAWPLALFWINYSRNNSDKNEKIKEEQAKI